jgi:hypothetical protein
VTFYIPDPAPAREIKVDLNGQRVASQTYSAPGTYTLTSAPLKPEGDSATLTIAVDKTFAGDSRQLGVVLIRAGFQNP